MCLQDSSYNGVGPEALRGSVLRFHLLGFGSRVRITGIQHGLQYTPAGIDKPFKRQERERKMTRMRHIPGFLLDTMCKAYTSFVILFVSIRWRHFAVNYTVKTPVVLTSCSPVIR